MEVIMIITEMGGKFCVTGSDYALTVSSDLIDVFLAGESVARLLPASALNMTTDDNLSCLTDVDGADVCFSADTARGVFTWSVKSSLWDEKIYTLECFNDRAEYYITVKGHGRVDSVEYFLRYDSKGKKLSGQQEFYEGFYPNVFEMGDDGTYPASEDCDICSTLTVPPMFFHTFKIAGIKPQLTFALVAEMGEHNFTRLSYNAGMYLSTDQSGHATVDGQWTTPKIVIYTATDNYDAGDRYASLYFDSGICPRGDEGSKPRFWYGPIACGWFEQQACQTPDCKWCTWMSKESLYTDMVRKLEAKDLHPRILILDDKWMDKYGTCCASPERWPDLRGFIDRMREKGIHTFLWYKLWCNEDIPDEYCVWDEKENTLVCDPTNPGYRELLREVIHRLISADDGCYNADGLKVDFAFTQPHGRSVKTYSGKYGAELLYEYIKLIREIAKEAKKEAVINASPSHPIFASLVDHARLHDYDSKNRRTYEEFVHRARIWGTALPTSLIDMDGGAVSTNRDVMRFLLGQAKHGIPDLYYASDFPKLKLTDEEWARVADEWKRYSDKCDILYGKDELL